MVTINWSAVSLENGFPVVDCGSPALARSTAAPGKRKLLKRHGFVPHTLINDKWRAYMAAARMPTLDCAVDCWGGNVTSPPATLNENQPVAPIDMTADITVPLLGLFGNDDPNPTPEQVDQIEAALNEHGKGYEFHRYDGAGHAFFNWHNERYRPEQAMDGWQKVFAFFETHLGGS